MSGAAKKRWQGRGFTFLELLFVLVIVAVLTALAVPRAGRTLERLTLENFVNELYLLSYSLRENAVSDGRLYYLQMPAAEPVFVAGTRDGEVLKNLTEGSVKKLRFYGAGRSFCRPPEGVSVSVDPAATTKVYFYPDGTTDAASLAFKNRHNDERKLFFGGSSGTIKIE